MDEALATIPEWLTLYQPLPTVDSLKHSPSFKQPESTWHVFGIDCSRFSTFEI